MHGVNKKSNRTCLCADAAMTVSVQRIIQRTDTTNVRTGHKLCMQLILTAQPSGMWHHTCYQTGTNSIKVQGTTFWNTTSSHTPLWKPQISGHSWHFQLFAVKQSFGCGFRSSEMSCLWQGDWFLAFQAVWDLQNIRNQLPNTASQPRRPEIPGTVLQEPPPSAHL